VSAVWRTITRRLVLSALAGLAVGILVLAIAAPLLAQEHDTQALRSWLASEANLVGDLSREGLRARDPAVLDPLAHRVATAAGVRVTLIDAAGVVLGESDEDRTLMENHATRPEVAAALAGAEGSTVRHSATVGRDFLYVAIPVRDGSGIVGVSRTALPLSALQSLAARLGGLIVAAGLAASALALATLVLLARAITRPIAALTARAERLASGERETFTVSGPEEVERLAAALRRMSENIQGARDLAEAERDRLASLIDELGEAVLIANVDGRVELANRAASERFGADLVGRRLFEIVREHELLDAVRAARPDRDAVAHVERADPLVFLRAIARRLRGGELLLVVQDLTTLRRLETVRRDFVANVSHELRTPIASLKAMAEALEAGALDDPGAARDFVSRMHAEIDGLAQLVEELLTLSRLESDELDLRRESVRPADLLTRARDRMAPLAARAAVALELAPADSLPAVLADRDRVAQVFANLIHNAVKYTPAGGRIDLRADRRDGAVVFTVRDTGIGIAAPELERVFERFYKSDRARSGGGTGLGLAIAKHIVQAHGGDIAARSEGEGKGSTFTFSLPLAP